MCLLLETARSWARYPPVPPRHGLNYCKTVSDTHSIVTVRGKPAETANGNISTGLKSTHTHALIACSKFDRRRRHEESGAQLIDLRTGTFGWIARNHLRRGGALVLLPSSAYTFSTNHCFATCFGLHFELALTWSIITRASSSRAAAASVHSLPFSVLSNEMKPGSSLSPQRMGPCCGQVGQEAPV